MKPESATALNGLAAILIVTGLAIMSPSGAFALFSLAGICALVSALLGSGAIRMFSMLLLLSAGALASSHYGVFRMEQAQYRGRTHQVVPANAATAPPNQVAPGPKPVP